MLTLVELALVERTLAELTLAELTPTEVSLDYPISAEFSLVWLSSTNSVDIDSRINKDSIKRTYIMIFATVLHQMACCFWPLWLFRQGKQKTVKFGSSLSFSLR